MHAEKYLQEKKRCGENATPCVFLTSFEMNPIVFVILISWSYLWQETWYGVCRNVWVK